MKKRPGMCLCLLFLIIRSISFLVTDGGQPYVKLPADSIFQSADDDIEVIVKGQVYKKADTSKVQILYLKDNSIYHQNNSYEEFQIIIYDETFQKIAIGETVELQGTLTAFEGAHNPGNFDQKFYYAKQHIYGSVWSENICAVSGKKDVFREMLYRMKVQWKQNLFEVLGEKNGAVLSAMLLGEKGEMDEELKEIYQKNGIGHILAISGLHISFIGLGIFRLLRKIGCPYKMAGMISVFFLFGYAGVIGISVSVLRACLMLLLRIGAEMTGRVYDMATSLSIAAVITVLWQPLYLFDAGFLLSYGAILGILVGAPAIEALFLCRKKMTAGIYASVGIQLILFPVQLYFFFEFPVYAIFLNLAVIPMMSLVLGLGMFGSGGWLLWKPIGVWLLKGSGILLALFEWFGRMSGRLPGNRMVFGQPKGWKIVCYYAVLAGYLGCVYVWKRRKKNKGRWKMRVCLLLFCIGSVLLFFPWRENGKVNVTIVDVGQGDGMFLHGPKGGTYLIDSGSSDVKEVGKYRLEPFLKSRGVGKLDYVFVSHGDADHYSGIEELIVRKEMGVRIECLVLPVNYREDEALCRLTVLAKRNGVRTVRMKSGQVLREEDMTITCVHPAETFAGDGNAASMVLAVKFKEFDMLCTGDVEEAGEETLIQNLKGKVFEVLKVAHHGSKNATSRTLIDQIQPKIAVISAGKRNRYGHPHQETLKRLKERGCKIYSTMENGAIQIVSDGKTVHVQGFH